ncbi:Riboflavin biosynthesis protein RibF [Corynebacterium heidelbergense]|nr:Riboflavin biosynthesis protein RibF [Corynebacterium heidelbergense]
MWYGLDRVPTDLGPTVVTIGVFDGVHRGHRELVDRAVAEARRRGIASVMFTFDPHPTVVFRPSAVPALLGTVHQRAEQAYACGIDHVVVVAFTRELAGWTPQEYVDRVLVDILHARTVIVGENFTFGRNAEGTSEMLAELGAQRGIDVQVVPLLTEGDHTICSTWIRGRLVAGDVAAAAGALGRSFEVEGEVVHGAGRGGRALGFPTANLYFPEMYALPAEGVYAGYVTVVPEEGEAPGGLVGTMPVGAQLPAAISVGTNPTFGHEPLSVESFILDHEADLYGRKVQVSFVERLRGQETYSGVEELVTAIERDVANTRSVLESAAAGAPTRP